MYFTGKLPLMVAGTCPPNVSSGLGSTVKLSADSFPNLEEHDDKATIEQTDKVRTKWLRIIISYGLKVPRAGLEPAQPFLVKGF